MQESIVLVHVQKKKMLRDLLYEVRGCSSVVCILLSAQGAPVNRPGSSGAPVLGMLVVRFSFFFISDK